MSAPPARQREALRQQMLLRALWRDAPASALQGHVRALRGTSAQAGLAAYRGNATALAERALGGHFPTVAALVGDESFAGLARAFWQRHPPQRGDLAEWGEALPDFIGASEQLAGEPYLTDVARLDGCVHLGLRAADAAAEAPALDALASHDPSQLALKLTPGAALLSSAWPVAAIWLAHQRPADDADRFDDVRTAFAAQRAEHAFVWRDGYAVRVAALGDGDAAFTRALLARQPLDRALDAAHSAVDADFAFDRWLARALASRWLAAVHPLESP